jgi:hypothetical protein
LPRNHDLMTWLIPPSLLEQFTSLPPLALLLPCRSVPDLATAWRGSGATVALLPAQLNTGAAAAASSKAYSNRPHWHRIHTKQQRQQQCLTSQHLATSFLQRARSHIVRAPPHCKCLSFYLPPGGWMVETVAGGENRGRQRGQLERERARES